MYAIVAVPAPIGQPRQGHGLIIVIGERLPGAHKDIDNCERAAAAMSCNTKVLSDLRGDNATSRAITGFVRMHLDWLSGGSFAAIFIASHGNYSLIEAQGGSTLEVKTLLQGLNLIDVPKQCVVFINKCRPNTQNGSPAVPRPTPIKTQRC